MNGPEPAQACRPAVQLSPSELEPYTWAAGKPGIKRGILTPTRTPSSRMTLRSFLSGPGRAFSAAPLGGLPVRTARAPARAARPADQKACPATAIWAATRTASNTTGTAPISSSEADPP